MNEIVIDKNDSLFKSNIGNSRLCVGVLALGNILFYFLEENLFILLFVFIFSVLIIIYSYLVYKAISYYLYIFAVGVYFITLSVVYQLYYLANYVDRYDSFIIFYLVILVLVVLDYFSLRRNGVFLRIFDGIDKSVYHVTDVFGENKSYLKISLINQNTKQIKFTEGSILYVVILFPVILVAFLLSPFVKSLPVVIGYIISKNYPSSELIITYVLTLILNLIFFKFIFMSFSGVMYFFKKNM